MDTRCADCRAVVQDAEKAELTACPQCGSTSVPENPDWDIDVHLNWQQLRVLCMWAEFWADRFPQDERSDRSRAYLRRIFAAVNGAKPTGAPPLTFAEEFADLKAHFPTAELVRTVGPETPERN